MLETSIERQTGFNGKELFHIYGWYKGINRCIETFDTIEEAVAFRNQIGAVIEFEIIRQYF